MDANIKLLARDIYLDSISKKDLKKQDCKVFESLAEKAIEAALIFEDACLDSDFDTMEA